MLLTVVVALCGFCNLVIIRIMVIRHILHLMTVLVVVHEGVDVGLIMSEMYRRRPPVMRREVAPVPR